MKVKAINVLHGVSEDFDPSLVEQLAQDWINGNVKHMKETILNSKNPGYLAKQVRSVLQGIDPKDAVAFNSYIFKV